MADSESPAPPSDNQLGIVVSPDASTQASPPAVAAPQPAVATPQLPEPVTDPQPAPNTVASSTDETDIHWTASEFVAHQKSAAWYGGLLLITIVLSVIVFLISHDIISTAFVIVGAIILAYLSTRQPRQLEYQLSSDGVQIGQKYHPYDLFSSFSVVPEGAFSSIVFMPLKRFAPTTTIYYAPEDEDRIINLLAPVLPLEEYRHDSVDRLMRRVRF